MSIRLYNRQLHALLKPIVPIAAAQYPGPLSVHMRRRALPNGVSPKLQFVGLETGDLPDVRNDPDAPSIAVEYPIVSAARMPDLFGIAAAKIAEEKPERLDHVGLNLHHLALFQAASPSRGEPAVVYLVRAMIPDLRERLGDQAACIFADALEDQLPMAPPVKFGTVVRTKNGIYVRWSVDPSVYWSWVRANSDGTTLRTDEIGGIVEVLSEGVDL